jgi:outer membrane protein OmpA-like peptidoglycan-associated protein
MQGWTRYGALAVLKSLTILTAVLPWILGVKMKRYLLAGVAVAALLPSWSAFAQGWFAGPEVGAQLGYVFDGSSGNLSCPGEGFFGFLAAVEGGGGGGGTSCATDDFEDPTFHYQFNTSGFVGGGHAGYNWQWGNAVLGVEGDLEGAAVSGSTTNLAGGFGVHTSMDFDASLRARAGWAFDRILVYGTGGVATGDVTTHYRVAAVVGGPLISLGENSDVRTGWTGGAGIEYAVTPNWDVGLEYRYTDLGRQGFSMAVPGGTVSDSNEYNFSAIRLRLSYRFAPPPPPPPPVAPMPAAAPAPPPMPQARTFLVFFDFDRYNLTPDARRVVEAAAASYKATGSARIDVSGYTDLAGTQAYNLRLSQRRADAVAITLERDGVPRNVMDVKWFGKEHPRVPTPDGVREPQNRRVEIVMP